jgi:hypothetical protein
MYPLSTIYEVVQVQRDNLQEGERMQPCVILTRDFEMITVSLFINDDPITRLDRVITPRGHGSMLGQTENGKFVVLTDQEFVTSSCCDLFDSEHIELIGKMRNVSWSKQIVVEKGRKMMVRIDPLAFAGRDVMICDRVRMGDRLGFVCGIDGNDVYVKWDDRKEAMKIGNAIQMDVVMRYAMIPLTGMIGDTQFSKSILSFSGTWVKPGDVLLEGDRVMECMGIRNDGLLVFIDRAAEEILFRDRGKLDLYGLRSDTF